LGITDETPWVHYKSTIRQNTGSVPSKKLGFLAVCGGIGKARYPFAFQSRRLEIRCLSSHGFISGGDSGSNLAAAIEPPIKPTFLMSAK
jgi:hypothetical protein